MEKGKWNVEGWKVHIWIHDDMDEGGHVCNHHILHGTYGQCFYSSLSLSHSLIHNEYYVTSTTTVKQQ